jgi:Papain-like cysteine protease AvrRpt2
MSVDRADAPQPQSEPSPEPPEGAGSAMADADSEEFFECDHEGHAGNGAGAAMADADDSPASTGTDGELRGDEGAGSAMADAAESSESAGDDIRLDDEVADSGAGPAVPDEAAENGAGMDEPVELAADDARPDADGGADRVEPDSESLDDPVEVDEPPVGDAPTSPDPVADERAEPDEPAEPAEPDQPAEPPVDDAPAPPEPGEPGGPMPDEPVDEATADPEPTPADQEDQASPDQPPEVDEPLVGGAGGDWPISNEVPDSAVKQITDASCVSASGEMLTESKLSQESILDDIGEWSNSESLARHLTEQDQGTWGGGYVEPYFDQIVAKNEPWAAEMFPYDTMNRYHHMVVVDGVDEDSVQVRDPWEGSSYTMTLEDFKARWTGNGVVKID